MTNNELTTLIKRQEEQIRELDARLEAGLITPTFHRIGVKMSARTIQSCKNQLELLR